MAGAQFVIDYEVTDTTIPVLRNDEILTDGSIILLDPGHPTQAAIASGQVATGLQTGFFPNVAWEEAKSLFGSGDAASLAFNSNRSATLTGNKGTVEITTKKGVHAIISQVNHDSFDQWFNIRLPQAYRDYFNANASHEFFVSSWRVKTRMQAATGYQFSDMALYFQNTSKFLAHEMADSRILGNSLNNERRVPANTALLNTPFIKNARITGLTGVVDAPATAAGDTGNSLMAVGGGLPAYGSSTYLNKCPSFITYRVYVEDLTVSKRTYAQVDAIDNALFTAAFGAGGRLSGDTYTDPATIA